MHNSILKQFPNGTSDCTPLKEVLVNGNPLIDLLISAIKNLQPIDILDIIPFEDKFISKAMVDPGIYNDVIVNLISHRK